MYTLHLYAEFGAALCTPCTSFALYQ